jgi:hypothetical protein
MLDNYEIKPIGKLFWWTQKSTYRVAVEPGTHRFGVKYPASDYRTGTITLNGGGFITTIHTIITIFDHPDRLEADVLVLKDMITPIKIEKKRGYEIWILRPGEPMSLVQYKEWRKHVR